MHDDTRTSETIKLPEPLALARPERAPRAGVRIATSAKTTALKVQTGLVVGREQFGRIT